MITKVKFKGTEYWLAPGFNCKNLSPLDHYNKDGELLANPFTDISYAIIEGNDILRFGQIIGTINDLEIINE